MLKAAQDAEIFMIDDDPRKRMLATSFPLCMSWQVNDLRDLPCVPLFDSQTVFEASEGQYQPLTNLIPLQWFEVSKTEQNYV